MPGIGGSLLIILVMIVVGSILAAIAAVAIGIASGNMDPSSLAQGLTGNLSLMYFLQMIAPIGFIWLVGNYRSYNPMISPVKINAPHIGKFNIITLGIVLLVLTIACSWVLDPISSFFPMPDNFKQMFSSIGENFWDTVISVAVLAPLMEEFVLRGTIERGMLTRYSAAGAILWSSFVFAAIHMNLWQAIPAFALGCVFGWVYYRSHSIWAVIFMHFVNNFSSIMMFRIFPGMDPDATSRENIAALTGSDTTYWVLIAGGAVLLVICILLLNKYLPKNPQSFKPKKPFLTGEETLATDA